MIKFFGRIDLGHEGKRYFLKCARKIQGAKVKEEFLRINLIFFFFFKGGFVKSQRLYQAQSAPAQDFGNNATLTDKTI